MDILIIHFYNSDPIVLMACDPNLLDYLLENVGEIEWVEKSKLETSIHSIIAHHAPAINRKEHGNSGNGNG